MPRQVTAENPPIRQVRFFYDWGHQWPLWECGAISPEHLGLSAELADDMSELYGFWTTNVEPETGWQKAPNLQAEFLVRAAQLAVRLQQEISPWGHVIFEIRPESVY